MMRLVLLSALYAIAGTAAGHAAEDWRFTVLLDGKPIGYHRFTLNDVGDTQELVSEARFNVKVLFFTAYRYTHDAKEVWRGSCLRRIDASTDDNGARKFVHGTATGEHFAHFEWDDKDANHTIDECVRTFAYWNPSILEATHLLNPQTGEYVPVHVANLGADALTVRGVEQPAQHYRLSRDTTGIAAGEQLQIDLWYSAERQWLALESLTPDGHRLHYRRE